MTYDEAVGVLRSWERRKVLFVHLHPDPLVRSAAPALGTLQRREMWPHADPAANPQTLGEVEFFTISRDGKSDEGRSRTKTVALYRSVFPSAKWLREGTALAFGTRSKMRFDFWLQDESP